MKLFFILVTALLSFQALAKDSRELSDARLKEERETSFYCPIGRDPMLDSSGAWQIKAIPGCTFAGPLDTKINRRILEPPVLNPLLQWNEFKAALQKMNCLIESDSGSSLRFRLPGGATLAASLIAPKQMQDPLFHFNVIPFSWGQSFISISASQPADIETFMGLAKNLPGNPLFWSNPHFEDEKAVLPRLVNKREYTPLSLVSKCGDGHEWKNFGGPQSLLLVGDLHNPPQAAFFRQVLDQKSFAWVGLESAFDFAPQLETFLSTQDPTVEEQQLFLLTYRYPKNLIASTKDIFHKLKSLKVKIILIDSADRYFNFPFTNLGSHGLMTAMRNQYWANSLPAHWSGTGVILGGLDHFLVTPSSDFQDFALIRYPGLEMGLIDPNEKCQP